jgi:hypothetical protein
MKLTLAWLGVQNFVFDRETLPENDRWVQRAWGFVRNSKSVVKNLQDNFSKNVTKSKNNRKIVRECSKIGAMISPWTFTSQ